MSTAFGQTFNSLNRPMGHSDGFNFKAMSSEVSIDDAQGIVECFVAAIGNKDSVGDIVAPGAFDGSLRRRRPRVVWGHDWNSPIGKVLDIYEVGPNDPRLPQKMRQAGVGGLFAKVQFNLRSERGREAFESVRFFGNDQEWSIGYKTIDAVFDNDRKANILREVELYEVSPVLHGANQLTGTISIKSDALTSIEDDEFFDYSEYIGEKSAEPLRDPNGGLTAAGRAHFRRTEGANLKPGVKGPADTPEKMRRKGSFLTRFFTNPSGPMKDDNGKPTRLALSARAWGEPIPETAEDAARLAAKGRRLLDRYQAVKEKGYPDNMLLLDEANDHKNNYGKDDDAIPAANPALGRDGNLGRALSTKFGGTVHLRQSDANQVIFDHVDDDDEKHTFRVSYHYEDGQFMFGDPVRVKPEVVYLEDPEVEETDEDSYPYHDGIDMESMSMHSGNGHQCSCGMGKTADNDSLEMKAGRVLSGRNLQRVRDALALLETVVREAGGGLEMKANAIHDVKTEYAADLVATLEPIALRYGATLSYNEYEGIVRIETPSDLYADMIEDAEQAANAAGVRASWNFSSISQTLTDSKV